MKKTKKILLFLLVCILAFSPICLATNTNARSNINGNSSNFASKAVNIINTDVYTGEQDVVIDDNVNGNVFAFGTTVTVKGEILGDLFAFGNSLVIDDTAVIHGNVFAFGSTIVIKGKVNYDVYGFAQSFELSNSGYINRDARLYAGDVKLLGKIKKDLNIIVSSITIPENAQNIIGGNLNYTSNQEFSIPNKAVLGDVKYTKLEENNPTTAQIISNYINKFITTIIYAIVVILLATFFAPKFIEKANYVLMKKPFASAGIGILSVILIPVISIVILMTGFLTYLSIATIALYALVLSITLAIFSMAIAKSIEEKLIKNPSKGKFILMSILSAIVLWVLQIIPFIGGYVSLFIYVVGLGVFLFAFFMRKDVGNLKNSSK